MPGSELSLILTSTYRERWESVKDTAQALARVNWSRLDPADLDASYFAWQTAVSATVRAAQAQSVSASNGYLAAFLASELGEEIEAARAPLGGYVGLSRTGRGLTDALGSPLIGVKTALKAGKDLQTALREGETRALRTIGLEIDHAARQSLQDSLILDPRIEGYRRAVRGTCGACLGAASKSFDAHVHFPVHPGCFPAGVKVSGPPPVAASKRWYEGDLVELRFRGGGLLASTPNHPVLTPSGWVAAGQLREGSDVVRSVGEQGGVATVRPDDDKRPTLIEDVAESLRSAGEVATSSMPLSPEDFHGDGASGYVDVVAATGFLQDNGEAAFLQQFAEPTLCSRHAALIGLPRLRHLVALLFGVLAPRRGTMGSLGIPPVLTGGSPSVALDRGFSFAPDLNARFAKNAVDRESAGEPVPLGESLLRFTGEVQTDQLVSVRRYPFSGHVYNLQSSSEQWYTANRTIVHNCACVTEPVVSGVPDRFPRPTGGELFGAMSEREQDEALGPEAAELVRSGAITLEDLVGTSPQETTPDFLTQRPVSAL